MHRSPKTTLLATTPFRKQRRSDRRGAAALEFALVLPILLLIVLGMFEIGRAIMVVELLNHSARVGARSGAIASGTTASVQSTVTGLLDGTGIVSENRQVNVLVNGVAGEVSNADAGDEITVEISVPYADVAWLSASQYLTGKTLSGRCVMRRE